MGLQTKDIEAFQLLQSSLPLPRTRQRRSSLKHLGRAQGDRKLDLMPAGKKAALFSLRLQRDAHPLVPKVRQGSFPQRPWVFFPQKECRSFSVVWKIILRCLNLSTIVYRANYFIFIVNLRVEEMISKI